MTNQFVKLYQKWTKDSNLTLKDMVALALVTDRMESSVKDMRFYDYENKKYFVIYRFEQLAEDMHVSVSSAKRTMKSLAEKGYVFKKTRMNNNGHRITKYFLPKFVSDKVGKFTFGIEDAFIPHQFITGKLDDKNVCVDSDFRFKKYHANQDRNRLTLTKEPKLTLEKAEVSHMTQENDETLEDQKPVAQKDLQEIQLHQVMRTLRDKCGVPKDAISSLAVLAKNEPAVLAQYADQIFKAKVSAKKIFERKAGLRVSTADVRFETNDYFSENLPDCIDTVVVNVIDKCKTLDKTCAYLFTSLKSFFLDGIQKYKFHQTDLMEPAYVGPEIPMIDISDPNRVVRS
ncbi:MULTISPECIES: helix-turn-helix domain-containing protein [Lactobacillaceae]|uniref:hypothetical protein n=1 Tax=Lactobacillaceae TaxID=33958 RepID=UPI001CC1CD5E|nr:hypothetical protein [Lentilactobacillus hilgardii]MBZ2202270.1 hypothetical protein [Lentilactobacillus hilgardii]MBZ2205278.1 hypothetical protein [Lentilactobacillus hilgardii]